MWHGHRLKHNSPGSGVELRLRPWSMHTWPSPSLPMWLTMETDARVPSMRRQKPASVQRGVACQQHPHLRHRLRCKIEPHGPPGSSRHNGRGKVGRQSVEACSTRPGPVSPVHPDNIAPHVPRRDGGQCPDPDARERRCMPPARLALCRGGAWTVPVRVKAWQQVPGPCAGIRMPPPGHPGWAARVGARVRGCRRVFSSTPTTLAPTPSGRVERSPSPSPARQTRPPVASWGTNHRC